MSDLQTAFKQAAEDIKGLAERPDNDTLLRLCEAVPPARWIGWRVSSADQLPG